MPKYIKGLAGKTPYEPARDRSAIDEWLSELGRKLQPVAMRLDELIEATVPDLTYAFKRGRPYYGTPQHGWIIEIAAYSVSVNLLFYGGADFDSPPPLGETDRTRYIKLTSVAEAEQPEVKRWIEQAARTPGWQ